MFNFVPIQESKGTEIWNYICWPVNDEEIFDDRIIQLKDLEMEYIALGGPHQILQNPILGKGHTGIVIRALHKSNEVALKCRRTDVSRSMLKEARILGRVNKAGLGPKLFKFSKDFLVDQAQFQPVDKVTRQ